MIIEGDSLSCAIPGCEKTFTRPRSHIKGKNQFCSRKHKEKGMILGLCNPSRLGTGRGVSDILRRRKYYKYRDYDKRRGYQTMTIGVREFCEKLSAACCHYCGSTEDVGYDRVDNKKGHHESNVVWACSLCNMTRGNRFTVEQMVELGKTIRTFLHNGK